MNENAPKIVFQKRVFEFPDESRVGIDPVITYGSFSASIERSNLVGLNSVPFSLLSISNPPRILLKSF